MRCEASDSFLLRPTCDYVMGMKIGSLVRYTNLDGEAVYGVVSSGVFKYTELTWKPDAVRVVWTDDGKETSELVEHLLDDNHCGLDLL